MDWLSQHWPNTNGHHLIPYSNKCKHDPHPRPWRVPDLSLHLTYSCAASMPQSVLTLDCPLNVQSLDSLTTFIHILCLPTMHSLLPTIIYHHLDSQLLPLILLLIWRRKWQATPVFLPGKSHGQRTLVSYSPRGHKRVGHDLTTKQQQQFSIYTLPPFLLARPPLLIPCTLGCKLCESLKHLSLILLFVCLFCIR